MTEIHPTAIVDPTARLGEDVTIGPFAIIEAGVAIGDGCRIGPRATIHSHVSIGPRCLVDTGAILGGAAQDAKCSSEETFLEIGADNQIREHVTIHRSNHEGGVTRLGEGNMLMAFVHIGHDCQLGCRIMMANLVTIGGHVQIDDRVVFGGLAAVHQWVRIGTMAMVGGMSGVGRDVPPYSICDGNPFRVRGINVVGLRRNGIADEARAGLHRAVRMLFVSGKHRGHALEELEAEPDQPPEVCELLAFVRRSREGRNGRQLEG